MSQLTKDTLFKAPSSKGEIKGDATTRAAWTIINNEVAQRDAKTVRLKAARLAKEAADEVAAQEAAPPPKKAKAAKTPKAKAPAEG